MWRSLQSISDKVVLDEVLRAVTIKSTTFWGTTPCGLVVHRRLRNSTGPYGIRFQKTLIFTEEKIRILRISRRRKRLKFGSTPADIVYSLRLWIPLVRGEISKKIASTTNAAISAIVRIIISGCNANNFFGVYLPKKSLLSTKSVSGHRCIKHAHERV
jgi:hypothetical protein